MPALNNNGVWILVFVDSKLQCMTTGLAVVTPACHRHINIIPQHIWWKTNTSTLKEQTLLQLCPILSRQSQINDTIYRTTLIETEPKPEWRSNLRFRNWRTRRVLSDPCLELMSFC